MKCATIEKLLPLYLENELSPEQRSAVETHLGECAACSELLSALRKIPSFLAGIPELEVSPSLQARLYAIPSTVPPSARGKKVRSFLDLLLSPSLQPVLTAASIFLVIISFFLFHPDGRFLSRSLNEQVHRGYSRVERVIARAEGIPGYLSSVGYTFSGFVEKIRLSPSPTNQGKN